MSPACCGSPRNPVVAPPYSLPFRRPGADIWGDGDLRRSAGVLANLCSMHALLVHVVLACILLA